MLAIFFTEGKNVPASRFRVEQFLPHLKKAGIICINFPSIPSKYYTPTSTNKFVNYFLFILFVLIKSFVRAFQIPFVLFADVVFIQRDIIPYNLVFYERLIWLLNRNIVFDFDDSIFLYRQKIENPIGKLLMGRDKIAETISMSKGVIVGNAYLANYAKNYNSNIFIIPTVINTDKYKPKKLILNKKNIIIGWMGTSSNLQYVIKIKDILAKIYNEFPYVSLKIVTDKFLFEQDFKKIIPTTYKRWSAEDEISDLSSFDIGIMPIIDNKWTKGKCGFKLIQYMSAGVPSIASRVGVNREIIEDGVSGFLASNKEEWYSKLSLLIKNKNNLMARFHQEGRKRIEATYSLNNVLPKLVSILRNTANR